MRHGYMYNGGFEKNYSSLKVGTTTYLGSDGEVRPLPAWPAKVDGIRVSYMEKSGKKFYAVRVQFEERDIVLKNPLLLDQMRHLGSRRFSPEPTTIDDELAETLLDDMMAKNPEQQDELALMINRVNQVRRANR